MEKSKRNQVSHEQYQWRAMNLGNCNPIDEVKWSDFVEAGHGEEVWEI